MDSTADVSRTFSVDKDSKTFDIEFHSLCSSSRRLLGGHGSRKPSPQEEIVQLSLSRNRVIVILIIALLFSTFSIQMTSASIQMYVS